MRRHFVRTVFMGFMIALLAFGGINMASAAKPTPGMLGFMFWAAEYPSSRKNYSATIPPNTCENGMGVEAATFNIPIPMPPLRQQ